MRRTAMTTTTTIAGAKVVFSMLQVPVGAVGSVSLEWISVAMMYVKVELYCLCVIC